MSTCRDLTNQVFGRLTVKYRDLASPSQHVRWMCLCQCGTNTSVRSDSLIRNITQSCGCFNREQHTIHGYSNTPGGKAWRNMMARCYSTTTPGYHRYAGRGIQVCDRWHQLALFLQDMGQPPHGMSLDRINNNHGYSPDNCRWATRQQQMRNMSKNRLLTFQGEAKTIAEWAELLHISKLTICSRLRRWDVQHTLGTPVKPQIGGRRPPRSLSAPYEKTLA
jgi:hypothetical protein